MIKKEIFKLTDKEIQKWTENSNYILKAIDNLGNGQTDIYNKLDDLEKTVYEKNSKYIGQNIFMWVCGIIIMGVVSLGVVTANNKSLITQNQIIVDERLGHVEDRVPTKIRHYINEKSGTRTTIEYFTEDNIDNKEG